MFVPCPENFYEFIVIIIYIAFIADFCSSFSAFIAEVFKLDSFGLDCCVFCLFYISSFICSPASISTCNFWDLSMSDLSETSATSISIFGETLPHHTTKELQNGNSAYRLNG